jgi:hypothetical protein
MQQQELMNNIQLVIEVEITSQYHPKQELMSFMQFGIQFFMNFQDMKPL